MRINKDHAEQVIAALLSPEGRRCGLVAPNGTTYRLTTFRRRGEDHDRPAVQRGKDKIVAGAGGDLFHDDEHAAIWAASDGRYGSIGEPTFRRTAVDAEEWTLLQSEPTAPAPVARPSGPGLSAKETAMNKEIARVTSWNDCIVIGCRLEDGHEGPHDLSVPASKPWTEPAAPAPTPDTADAPTTQDEWAESELETLRDGSVSRRPLFPIVDLSTLPAGPAAAAEETAVLAQPFAVSVRPAAGAPEAYRPKHLERWTLPPCYMGAEWPDYFVFLGRTRDSRCLEESNFWSGLEAIGGETDTVMAISENHWACGWVEWIAIHESDSAALRAADEIMEALEDYPVVDEDDFSRREDDAASETWRTCYSAKERCSYIRQNRSQFDFDSLADMIRCVRGEFFNGYASELIC